MKRIVLIILSVLLSFGYAPLSCWLSDGAISSVSAAPYSKSAAQKKKEAQKKAEQKKKEAQKKAAQKQKEAAQKQKEAQKKAAQKQKQVEQKQKEVALKQKEAQKEAAQKQKMVQEKPVSTPAQEAAAFAAKVAEVEAYNKRVAAYQLRDIAHRIGLWGQVGYSSIFPAGFAADAIVAKALGGVGGGVGLGYQMRYKKYLLTTGVEYQAYNSASQLSVPVQSFGVQEYPTMQYHYNFDNMQDKWSAGYVQIPILMGMELPKWYWQAGVKVGLNIYAQSALSTTITTSVSDQELIDDLLNMPTHLLGTSQYAMEEPVALQFNPNVALAAEVGMSLDSWLKPRVKKGRRMTPAQKMMSSLRYRLALFAEYGVMNIYNSAVAEGRTNALPVDLSGVQGKPAGQIPLVYTSSLQTSSAVAAKLNPFMAGVKFSVMYELPRPDKKPLPMPIEPKPRMAVQVINAATGMQLGNAQVMLENLQTGTKTNTTTNSKGVMLARYSKGNYRIAAAKTGYLPCDTITWSHMSDLSDTIRFALMPEPKPIVYTLCGYVRNKETAQLLSAAIHIQASENADLAYNGATNDEGLFVSDLLAGSYLVRINSVGYLPLDTLVQFEQDTLQFAMTPIKEGIKVKIDRLYFATNKTIILPESEEALDNLANFLKDNASVSICIIGHTDNVGTDADNMRLSIGRSEAVRADLIMRGIDGARIEAIGKGETAPVADNETEEGRAQNRRVEFEITDTKGDDIQQIYE